MTKLLKIAGVTAGKQASGIKVDELGRIELSRTVEPKRIIGNVLEPYAQDYKGPVSVFGLELYAVNSEKTVGGLSHIQPTPDGWLMYTYGALYRYDSKGAVIWEAEGRIGGGSTVRDGLAAIHGGYVYAVTQFWEGDTSSFAIDKISYKTGKVVKEGGALEGAKATTDLVYAASIDRLIGVIGKVDGSYALIYVHPETLNVEYSVATFTSKLGSVFGVGQIGGYTYVTYENGNIYVLVDMLGVATAKIDANIEVTVQRLAKKYENSTVTSAGIVLNGDVYSEQFGPYANQSIMRNGKAIFTRETSKIGDVFRGGTAGNLALWADGNKVLAFDKENLVMSVEIPHDIVITSIAGDSMGNIFVATTGGIYILGDTLQIKGYQLVG